MTDELFKNLDISQLKGNIIFLDIDGTITSDGHHHVEEEVLSKLKILSQNNKLLFCSNKNNCARNQKISGLIGVQCLDGKYKKPSRKILNLVDNKDGAPLVVIGDKLLTDGLFAKNIGARFIKVKRIFSKEDSFLSKFFYFIDDLLEKFVMVKNYKYYLSAVVLLWIVIIGVAKFDLYQKSILTSDMALYPNILWNTNFNGDILYNKMLFDWYGYKTFLNEHFSPTILLLAPLYALLPHPLTLVFLQTIVAGITAFLVYFLGRQILKVDWLAFLLAVGYLLHPSLLSATVDNVYGFHHDILLMPLVILAAIFLFRKKILFFAITLFFLFGLKENIPIAGLILGIVLLFSKEYKKYGLITLLFSLTFSFFGLFLLPFLTANSNHHALDVLGLIKDFSFQELVLNLKSFSYWSVLLLFLPAIFAPEVLVVAGVDLAMYFFARKLPFYHHVFFVYPIFIVAAVIGLKKMLDKIFFLNFAGTKFGRVATLILPMVVLFFIAGDLLVIKQYFSLEKKFSSRKIDLVSLSSFKNSIPADKCLVTTSDLAVYFVNRHCLSWSEKSLATSDYILVNRNSRLGFDGDANFIKKVDSLGLKPVLQEGDLVLFKNRL